MHFLSFAASSAWCDGLVGLSEAGIPMAPRHEPRYARAPLSTDLAFCRQLEQALQPRDECLLWVTRSDVWRSSENLHLYYRLRQSYGDSQQLDDAPGHLFLRHESADLISFLQVGLLCGWDMHLIPSDGYARAFVSHDEFVDFVADEANANLVDDFAAAQGGSRIMMNAPVAAATGDA
jgi:hypothetical protein